MKVFKKESDLEKKERLLRIIGTLKEKYPDVRCFLLHKNPYELLVSTRLSAQTTDLRVNMVTPALFERYPTARHMAEASLEDVSEYIKTVGIYKNKAKDIIACCRVLVEHYDGHVPDTMEELIKLPGVGRKTASVVLGSAFGKPAIAVDTHFGRIMRRMGFTVHTNPEKVEEEMLALVPEEEQVSFCHRIISLGREICKARRPECEKCPVADDCMRVIKDTEN